MDIEQKLGETPTIDGTEVDLYDDSAYFGEMYHLNS